MANRLFDNTATCPNNRPWSLFSPMGEFVERGDSSPHAPESGDESPHSSLGRLNDD